MMEMPTLKGRGSAFCLKKEVAWLSTAQSSLLDCELFDMLSQSAMDVYFYVCDLSTGRSRWSSAAVEEFDLKDEYMEASDWMWLCRIHPEEQIKFVRNLELMMAGKGGDVHHCEYRIRNKSGQYVWIRSRGVLRRDQDNNPAVFAVMLRNMGLNPKYDTTTNLYTIHEFRARLYEVLSRPNQAGGVLLFDIDDFSRINGSHDYAFGNKVLRAFAEKLLSLHMPGFLFRMDGDKFAFWMDDAEPDDLEVVFARYSTAAAELLVGEEEIPLVLTGGYVMYPKDADRAEDLHRRLEVAMNTAKHRAPGSLCAYTAEMYRDEQRIDALRSAIHAAVLNEFEGFSLRYQPQLHIKTSGCPAAEAILCWSTAEYPDVTHEELMEALEDIGDILSVGCWAMEHAMQIVHDWQKIIPDFGISMDISSRQIVQKSFLESVCQMALKFGLSPNTLCLELNNGCYAAGDRHLTDLIRILRSHNITVALDGFSPEWFSVEMLRKLSPRWVKLSSDFAGDAADAVNPALPALLALFHQLGISVCIKGIAGKAQAQLANRAGADFVQGQLYADPMDADAFYKEYIKPRST